MLHKYKPEAFVTVEFLMDNYLWEDFCEETGVDPFSVNSGEIHKTQYVKVPESWEVKLKIPQVS